MGFWQQVVPQNQQKTGEKHLKLEKKNLVLHPPVNPSTALVTGVCVTPALTHLPLLVLGTPFRRPTLS